MNLEEDFYLYVSAYYGIDLMDEYPLKIYVLKEIEDKIRDIVKKANFTFDINKKVEKISKKNDIEKLNDALYVLRIINYKIDFIIMINHKIKEMKSR